MKKVFVIFGIILLLALTGCGVNKATDELNKNDKKKAEAKVGDKAAKSEATNDTSGETKKEDIWTYYDNAKWSDNFKGLKLDVEKVVVSDKAPTVEDENAKTSAVGIKFKMENTTQGKFTAYPDQAVLVTSTGEQIESPEMFVTDHLGGEIDKGVIKEGNIIWYLQRGHAADITWIKLKFSGHINGEEDFESESKDFEFEIKLK